MVIDFESENSLGTPKDERPFLSEEQIKAAQYSLLPHMEVMKKAFETGSLDPTLLEQALDFSQGLGVAVNIPAEAYHQPVQIRAETSVPLIAVASRDFNVLLYDDVSAGVVKPARAGEQFWIKSFMARPAVSPHGFIVTEVEAECDELIVGLQKVNQRTFFIYDENTWLYAPLIEPQPLQISYEALETKTAA